MASLKVSTRFESLEAGKKAVLEMVVSQGESFKVSKAASMFWVAVCKLSACFFRVRIVKNNDGARITKLTEHNCPHSTHQNFRQAHSVSFLTSNHQTAVIDNREITPRQVQSNERLQNGNQINYLQAWRVRENIRKELEGDEQDSFPRLPALLNAMAAGDKETVTNIDMDADSKQFIRCFVYPRATRFAFRHYRKFVAFDGTFTKSRYRMTLLVAVTIDGNDETLPLCWALVPMENIDHWSWFMKQFALCFYHFMVDPDTVVISDRDKGIQEAVTMHLPLAKHAHCCQHIADNVQHTFGKACRDRFWAIAYAKIKTEFDLAIMHMQELRKDAGDYLTSIPQERWTAFGFPLPRYGHMTSNIVESVNAQWLVARRLPPLQLLNHLWTTMMAKFYIRYHSTFRTPRITNACYQYLQQQITQSRAYYVIPSDNNQAMVIASKDGHQRIVNLIDKTCTCLDFQDRGIPCRHACAVCTQYCRNAEDYIDSTIYSVSTYRSTYERPLPPFLSDNLSTDDNCKAPNQLTLRGRPPTKRKRRDEQHRTRINKCSYCHSSEHNRRTCRQASGMGGTIGGSRD